MKYKNWDEIVIKIPREWLNDMAKKEFIHVDALCEIILNGYPISERHGRLIDADARREEIDEEDRWVVDLAPTFLPPNPIK